MMDPVHKFTTDIGDGRSQSFAIHHNLNERDVFVSVYDVETGESLEFRGMDTCGLGMIVTFTTRHGLVVHWPGWKPGPSQARVVVTA